MQAEKNRQDLAACKAQLALAESQIRHFHTSMPPVVAMPPRPSSPVLSPGGIVHSRPVDHPFGDSHLWPHPEPIGSHTNHQLPDRSIPCSLLAAAIDSILGLHNSMLRGPFPSHLSAHPVLLPCHELLAVQSIKLSLAEFSENIL